MENFTETEITPTPTLKEQRGSFLSVLCALTWVSTGLNAFTAIISLAGGKAKVQNTIVESEELLENTDNEIMYGVLEATIKQNYVILEVFYPFYLSTLIFAALGAYAAYLMYNLKKTGFYIYIAYSVLFSLHPYFFMNNIAYIELGVIFAFAISLLFIILYAVNLKRMTN
ncbi:MAG TPA: hypothetical protein EYG85_05140 [Crocinitomix sp.]|nr:hypothetical protein [Crocinitomix sp.]